MREEFQVSQFALKGLVRCDTCGSTLVLNKQNNGLQCHKYARGTCSVSHFINLPSLNQMVIDALKEAVVNLSFNITLSEQQTSATVPLDFESLIHAEQLKLERAKQAYQAGVDSLNEYKAAKNNIERQIQNLKDQKAKSASKQNKTDLKKFAHTVTNVIEIMENKESSEELKNKAFKSVLQKIIFYKPERRIELFFYK